jgi:serine/threonine protein phosphatase PrpC
MISVKRQASYSDVGKRSNNEDNYGFVEGSAYVLCDGVGGAEKGEVASELVVTEFIRACEGGAIVSAQEVVRMAEAKMTEHASLQPNSAGMATTLTFLQIRPGGVYVAWVGDSRIYQFRRDRIVFQTRDHSWVNEAVDAGIISEEEAVNHPKGNVITRAVQGTHKPVECQDRFIANIEDGDVFLMCSDGVLEAWSNEDLSALFAQYTDVDEITKVLANDCREQSRDNNTAIVIEFSANTEYLTNNQQLSSADNNSDAIEAVPLSDFETNDNRRELDTSMLSININKRKVLFFSIVFVVILSVFSMLFVNKGKKENEEGKKEEQGEYRPDSVLKDNQVLDTNKVGINR